MRNIHDKEQRTKLWGLHPSDSSPTWGPCPPNAEENKYQSYRWNTASWWRHEFQGETRTGLPHTTSGPRYHRRDCWGSKSEKITELECTIWKQNNRIHRKVASNTTITTTAGTGKRIAHQNPLIQPLRRKAAYVKEHMPALHQNRLTLNAITSFNCKATITTKKYFTVIHAMNNRVLLM